jgi:para-nitrobenzyl esterase
MPVRSTTLRLICQWLRSLCVVVLLAQYGVGCSHADEVVRLRNGLVQGVTHAGVTQFRGIPFAAPPLGELRWRAPQPAASWAGVLRADAFKPMCMTATPAIPGGDMEAVSEDCLYLNIWTPAKPSAHRLPVMVWIYGGGMRAGSASSPVYWGDQLVREGVITVNLSYRVGVFGFLSHPDLSRESGYGASGNYGIMDMIAALQWVRDNIAAFGGDPDNVTVFGQSSGSFGVGYLIASPLAKGLFHRGIGQSGADMNPVGLGLMSPTDAEASGVRVAERLGVSSAANLRRIPAAKVLAADPQWPMDSRGNIKSGTVAVMDGHVLPATMYETLRQGRQNDVPVLIGYNTDEGGNLLSQPLTGAAYAQSVRGQYGEFARELLLIYPPAPEDVAVRSQRRLLRDNWFGWPMWTWARLQSEKGAGKVWFYNFSQLTNFPAGSPQRDWGAGHGLELPYTFGHADYLPPTATGADRRTVAVISGYWTNFARSGDPNGPGLPSWPAFTEADQRIMNLGEPLAARVIDPVDLQGLQLQDRYMATLSR